MAETDRGGNNKGNLGSANIAANWICHRRTLSISRSDEDYDSDGGGGGNDDGGNDDGGNDDGGNDDGDPLPVPVGSLMELVFSSSDQFFSHPKDAPWSVHFALTPESFFLLSPSFLRAAISGKPFFLIISSCRESFFVFEFHTPKKLIVKYLILSPSVSIRELQTKKTKPFLAVVDCNFSYSTTLCSSFCS